MSDKRKSFFGMRYEKTGLPVHFDNLGNDLQIAGMVLSGNDMDIIVYLPDENGNEPKKVIKANRDDWFQILKYLDDPQIFELDDAGNVKAVHRKCMRKVGGGLQWEIFHRDDYKCMYCGKQGGENGLVLTADHFVPVEKGGQDLISNLLTACRKCNKKKGSQDPEAWCSIRGNTLYPYSWYGGYLGIIR